MDQPDTAGTLPEQFVVARRATVERLVPVAERTAAAFASALRATLSKMPEPDRLALLDRAANFFTEAMNKATADIMLVCIYQGGETRAARAIGDFLVMRACSTALRQLPRK